MTKSITFALAIVLALTTWLAAERKYRPSTTVEMVTSFDFAAYPACRTGEGNCIQGIRFYDADSGQRLAEAQGRPGEVARMKFPRVCASC